jgi:hypothetical protein
VNCLVCLPTSATSTDGITLDNCMKYFSNYKRRFYYCRKHDKTAFRSNNIFFLICKKAVILDTL